MESSLLGQLFNFRTVFSLRYYPPIYQPAKGVYLLNIQYMPNSAQTKLSKALFRELPYNGQNIRQCHGSFNNLMPIENLPSKKYLDCLPSLNEIDLFSLNADNVNNSDLEYSSIRPVQCKYYSPDSFSLITNKLNKQVFRSQLTLFHNNMCSLKSNLQNLQTH